MNNLYLVGFMGTGKSSAGKAFARSARRKYLDLDNCIERREGMRIADIFAQKGEAYFRGLEKSALRDVSVQDGLVVSCGGGIVIDPENVEVMQRSGTVVCLTARPEVILRRTGGRRHRPLLNVPDPRGAVEELLRKRAPFYASAGRSIDTSDLTVSGVVKKLRELVG